MLSALENIRSWHSSHTTDMVWQSAARTHMGSVRKMNEDAIFSNESDGLWAVADGMGGHEAGEVASQMIVHALGNIQNSQRLSQYVENVDLELMAVNKRIQQHSEMIMESRILGSAIVVLIIRGMVGVCLWAGDSRVYRIREGQLERLTRDHSRVEELINSGLISPEEARSHPESNIITRAVGAGEELFLDHCTFLISPGDNYLLCSDGLYNCLTDPEIIEQIQKQDVDQSVQGLIDRALAKVANDNVSAIVVRNKTMAT